jgi:hypothetical protein
MISLNDWQVSSVLSVDGEGSEKVVMIVALLGCLIASYTMLNEFFAMVKIKIKKAISEK